MLNEYVAVSKTSEIVRNFRRKYDLLNGNHSFFVQVHDLTIVNMLHILHLHSLYADRLPLPKNDIDSASEKRVLTYKFYDFLC